MKKLSKEEMKKVVGGKQGGGPGVACNCNSKDDCKDSSKPICYNGLAYNCVNKPGDNYQGVCDK